MAAKTNTRNLTWQEQQLFFIAGNEPELLEEKLAEVTAYFVKPGDQELALERYEGEDTSICDIFTAANTRPFATKVKLVIACSLPELSSASAPGYQSLLDELAAPLPEFTKLIIYLRTKPDGKLKVIKYLRKHACCWEFLAVENENKQGINQLTAELCAWATKHGKRLSTPAAFKLAERSNYNYTAAVNALARTIPAIGSKNTIEPADIEAYVDDQYHPQAFKLADAFIEGQQSECYRLRQGLAELSELAQNTLILNRVRFLIQAKSLTELESSLSGRGNYNYFKDNALPRLSEKYRVLFPESEKGRYNIFRQHPFVIFKLIQNSTRFSKELLWKIFAQLTENDYHLKNGFKPESLLLDNLILTYCQ